MRINDKVISSNKIEKLHKKKTNNKNFSNFLQVKETEEQPIVVESQAILTVEETEEKKNSKKKYQAIQNGKQILKILKKLQQYIITGYCSKETINEMILLLEKPLLNESLNDHDLENILQELETRAYVESAKLKKIKKDIH